MSHLLRRRSGAVGLSLLVAAAGSGCAGDGLFDPGAAHEDDPIFHQHPEDLPTIAAAPGAWMPSPATLAAGDTQFVPYTGGGPWDGGAHCVGSLDIRAQALGDFLMMTFPGIDGYGGYECRVNTNDADGMSVHGSGRALDVMIPMVGGDADNDIGDPIAALLVERAQEIGMQYVIWDQMEWGAARSSPKLTSYNGPNKHIDHLHVELEDLGWSGGNGGGGGGGGGDGGGFGGAGDGQGTEATEDDGPAPTGTETVPGAGRIVPGEGTGGGQTATVVNTDSLNMRSGPGVDFPVVLALPAGTVVDVLGGPSDGWYNVSYAGSSGWCSATYLTLGG